MSARLQLTGITKVYPSVVANDGIDLTVRPGEIHAVLGENGAGKSTLMKIIYGAVKPDAGTIEWEGRVVTIANPARARRLGIGMVFQHFSLFETLTVADNIALALDGAQAADLPARIRDVSARYGLPLDPARYVHTMSVGERQRVEIVRCLLQDPRLLIMDEPTSVLTPQAVEKLFGTLRRLAEEGCSILYISHKLDEIRALCHKATVLRAGKVTGDCDPRQETPASLARMMVGGEIKEVKAALAYYDLPLPIEELCASASRAVAWARKCWKFRQPTLRADADPAAFAGQRGPSPYLLGALVMLLWELGNAALVGLARSWRTHALDRQAQVVHRAFEGLGEAVVLTDRTGRVVLANDAAAHLLGPDVRHGDARARTYHRYRSA